jgi:hypothetical protein
MDVKLIDDRELWDKSVDASPYGTLFHKWDFLKIIEKHSGCKLYPYGIYRKEELACQFPLFIREAMGVKMVFSPPPGLAILNLGFIMGPIYDKLRQRRKESYVNSILDDMEAVIKKVPAKFVHFSTVNGFVDIRPFKWNDYDVRMNYSYAIDLRQPLEKIWEDFDEELKREITNAGKLPLSVRTAKDVEPSIRAMKELYRRRSMAPPIQNFSFLKDVLTTFPDNFKMDFLYNGEQLTDMMLSYQFKDRLVLWLWKPDPANTMQNGGYMVWDYIKNNKAKGLNTIEIPAASIERSILFESKFNAPVVYNFSITKKDFIGGTAEKIHRRLAGISE